MNGGYRTAFITLTLLGAVSVRGLDSVVGSTAPPLASEQPVRIDDLIRSGMKHEADEDFPAALACFKTAAEKGSPEGAFRAASYLLSGRVAAKQGAVPVVEDLPGAIELLESSATKGHPEAMRVLGACYAKGRGVSQDKIEACKWWKLASDRGDEAAKAYLGHLQDQLTDADRIAVQNRANKFIQPTSTNAEGAGQQKRVRVKLNGISGTASRRVALINNQPFVVGEQKRLSLAPGTTLLVRCLEISSSTVQIQENDSTEVVTLTFGQR